MTLESSTDITGPDGNFGDAEAMDFSVFPYDDGTGFRIIWESRLGPAEIPTRTISYNQDGTVQDGPIDIAPYNGNRASAHAEVDDGNGGTVHFYISKADDSDEFLIAEVDLVTEETPTPLPLQVSGEPRVAFSNITTLRMPQSDGGPDRTFVYVSRSRNLQAYELSSDGTIVYLDTYSLPNSGNSRHGAEIYQDGAGNYFGIYNRAAIVQFNEDGSITPPPTGRLRARASDRALVIGDRLHIAHQNGDGHIDIYESDTPAVEPVPIDTDAAVCFADGVSIQTSRGDVAVEDLRAGDMVLTMDDGYQPIRWIGSRKLSAAALQARPKLRPVRIKAGALGHNLPARDLIVSRQHRMLVRSKIVERMFDVEEVLIPAIKLCELDGVDVVEGATGVEYFHMLFDQHQVVYAEKTPSESLFTGPEALKSLSDAAREEIATLFPELVGANHAPVPARLFPAGRAQKQLMQRHAKNNKSVLSV